MLTRWRRPHADARSHGTDARYDAIAVGIEASARRIYIPTDSLTLNYNGRETSKRVHMSFVSCGWTTLHDLANLGVAYFYYYPSIIAVFIRC